jgi:hypothetical protein
MKAPRQSSKKDTSSMMKPAPKFVHPAPFGKGDKVTLSLEGLKLAKSDAEQRRRQRLESVA